MTTLKDLKNQKIIALTAGAWSNLAQKQLDFNILVRTRDLLKVLPALNIKPGGLHDSKSPVPGVYFVKFEGDVDVYGTINHVVKYWPHKEWLKIKKQGYYMA